MASVPTKPGDWFFGIFLKRKDISFQMNLEGEISPGTPHPNWRDEASQGSEYGINPHSACVSSSIDPECHPAFVISSMSSYNRNIQPQTCVLLATYAMTQITYNIIKTSLVTNSWQPESLLPVSPILFVESWWSSVTHSAIKYQTHWIPSYNSRKKRLPVW